jgi:hypothetical protein
MQKILSKLIDRYLGSLAVGGYLVGFVEQQEMSIPRKHLQGLCSALPIRTCQ